MGFLCTIWRVFLAAAIAAFAGPAVAQPAGFVEIAQISFTHPYYGDRPVPVVTQLGTTAQHANRLIDTPDFGPSTQVDLPIPSATNLPWPDDRDLPSLPADIFVILK